MSKKLDKLREVNTTLVNIINKLETKAFIENIYIVNEKFINNEKPKPITETK